MKWKGRAERRRKKTWSGKRDRSERQERKRESKVAVMTVGSGKKLCHCQG